MTWKVGDTEPSLTGAVTSNGTALDVSAASAIEVHIQRPDGTVLSSLATVTAPASGGWARIWDEGDLNKPGTYQVEIEITWPGGRQQTTPTARFVVGQQIA